ncbi:MAG TPA: phosphodiester glycosidase family protein [Rhodanobacteraceae bacterium]|jgi:uncharacterized protein YigE (DUF2233 family)|nr:phosphodiester glycosidase family protein [Rhodanobacteraceae bacterium]
MQNAIYFRNLAALVALTAVSPSAAALETRTLHAGEDDFRVVTVNLAEDSLDIYWRDAEGEPYGSIAALKRKGEADQHELLFATNAGIYDRDYRPLGLTIADGKLLRHLNPAHGGGGGNFGLQPNGIFYVDREGHAGVIATSAWPAQRIDARVATQSGPMLVIDGELNPGFVESSDSRKWRSGVCAQAPGRVVFAVSETPVTFHAFARIFRDNLGCRDALYLDGTLSQIYTAADGYAGAPDVMVKPYAGMLAVFTSKPASP